MKEIIVKHNGKEYVFTEECNNKEEIVFIDDISFLNAIFYNYVVEGCHRGDSICISIKNPTLDFASNGNPYIGHEGLFYTGDNCNEEVSSIINDYYSDAILKDILENWE